MSLYTAVPFSTATTPLRIVFLTGFPPSLRVSCTDTSLPFSSVTLPAGSKLFTTSTPNAVCKSALSCIVKSGLNCSSNCSIMNLPAFSLNTASGTYFPALISFLILAFCADVSSEPISFHTGANPSSTVSLICSELFSLTSIMSFSTTTDAMFMAFFTCERISFLYFLYSGSFSFSGSSFHKFSNDTPFSPNVKSLIGFT